MKLWMLAVVVGALGMHGCGSSDKPSGVPADATVTGLIDATVTGLTDAGTDAAAVAKTGAPPEVLKAAKEWPTVNRDYAGTRATFDSTISKATIGSLAPAWTFELPGAGTFGAATASALVLDGVVYYVDMASNVFAIDAATGVKRWSKMYEDSAAGPNGIAVGYGKVFTTSSDKTFVALDATTGQELWMAPIEVPKNGGIGVAPVVYGGLVFLSTEPVNANSQYLGGVNGTLYALDEATGRVVWSFETVADKTLWGHPDVNSGGGAWYPPTIDVAHDVMYWGIGNPAAYPGTADFPNGTSHPGDNLYTNSILALGRADGKYLWHYQERPHDFFDLDFQNPPILVTTQIAGVERHLAVGSGKTGTVVAVDTDDHGKLLWRAVVGKHDNDNLTELPDAGAVVFPGDLGGVETPPAYADGTVYVTLCNQGRQFFPTKSGALDATGTGEVLALDVATGTVKWKKDLPMLMYGSATVVNDLLLTSTADGNLYAFDRASGDQVWTYKVSGINAPLTVSGNLLIIPAGGGLGTPSLVALKVP
jgi:glucose dehydrogenase